MYSLINKSYEKAAVIIKGPMSSQTPLSGEQKANKDKEKKKGRLILKQQFQKEILNIRIKIFNEQKYNILTMRNNTAELESILGDN